MQSLHLLERIKRRVEKEEFIFVFIRIWFVLQFILLFRPSFVYLYLLLCTYMVRATLRVRGNTQNIRGMQLRSKNRKVSNNFTSHKNFLLITVYIKP